MEDSRYGFLIGDWVYASDWCYGQIVDFNDEFDCAVVEFETDRGGGTALFDFDELMLA